ncbi:MAG: hypothetical protein JNL87_11725 [Burkholderiaceae bacterium]|nr:hypothetical protein [Burkholderiaceae bacterium]
MHADLPAYFATWSAEIASRASRVRLLIGPRHWLSDGTHKEFLVREFLFRHLPTSLIVGRGFIRSLSSDDVSREVDVLIADPARQTPIFNEGGLLVVTPSAAVANIEVKSTYRRDVLQAATKSAIQVRAVVQRGGSAHRLWSAILFATCETGPNLRQIVDDVAAVLQDSKTWADFDATGIAPEDRYKLLPSVVCILDRCLVFLERDPPSTRILVRAFDCGDTAAALALAQLFAFVRASMSGEAQLGELDELLERLTVSNFHSTEVAIP